MGSKASRLNHAAAPEWERDETHDVCQRCEMQFSAAHRKHHCRACGIVVCGDCGAYTRVIPQFGYGDKPVRVCYDCNKKPESQVVLEVKAFMIATQVYGRLAKVQRDPNTIGELDKIQLKAFAAILAELASMKNLQKKLLLYTGNAFELLAINWYQRIGDRVSSMLAVTKEAVPKSRDLDLTDIGLKYSDVKQVLDQVHELEESLSARKDAQVQSDIAAKVPPDFESNLRELERVSGKIFEKEHARGIETKLLAFCKKRIAENKKARQIADMDVHERNKRGAAAPVHDPADEVFLNKFLKALRDARGNAYVHKEAILIGYQFLFHILVACYKQSYHAILRAEDNPLPRALYSAISQSYRLAVVSEEFCDHVKVKPPYKYRLSLRKAIDNAKSDMKRFTMQERERLENYFKTWPLHAGGRPIVDGEVPDEKEAADLDSGPLVDTQE